MFESLQQGLQSAFKTLRGKGRLTEANMREGLKLVEQSLLEADVSYSVIKDFMSRVAEQALGEKVLLALKPHEQLVGIVHSELIHLLGPVDQNLPLSNDVNVVMMCGLQGSGKTTTCGKLASYLLRQKVRPMLVAADLQRPAAIEQLHVIGRNLDVPVFSEPGVFDPVSVCQHAIDKAREDGIRMVILDTAGRLAIDEDLMNQLREIDRRVHPHEVLLVVDGMTGQDAVHSASAFHEALELNGVIMTKLDGDARGGALLSVKHVTGVPVKFIGTGEQLDALEPFRPEGMASRILGMGDILALVDQAHQLVDVQDQARLQAQLEKGQFTLEDFRDQMVKFARPGLMQKMMGLLPGMGQLRELMGNEDAGKEVRRMVGVVDSMTPAERRDPKIVDPMRRRRIATGAGVPPQQVSELIKQFETMKPYMTGMAGMRGGDRMQMMNELKDRMLDPSLQGPKAKKGTGKRLTAKEREKLKKQREKFLREKRRRERNN